METLFENYELFLREHASDITSPSDAVKLIADNSMFSSYIDALTEGLTPAIRSNVINVCNRQRQMLLTEAANVPSSMFGFGWTVLSLPILVDIYSEPVISELCNVYTSDSPIVSIPRVRIYASTTGYDGVVTERVIPTSRQLVRPDFVTKSVTPAVPYNVLTNVFPAAGEAAKFKMNRRYLMVNSLSITCTSSGGAPETQAVTVNFRPDNRAQILKEFTFKTTDEKTVTATFQGNINWDSGVVFYNVVINDDGDTHDTDIVINSAQFLFRFVPVSSMVGRTKVTPKIEMTDLTIDLNEDFLIDLTQEDIQDYRSIFKIDLARTLSEAIKRQIMLNKDHDLSFFLASAQSDIAANGAAVTLDFAKYTANTSSYTPTSAMDIFKNIAPKIAYVTGAIKRNFNMYPSYIVTGLNTAAMLRSLQDMVVSMPNVQGEIGFNGSVAGFLKLKVLESPAIADNDIYMSTKAPQNALEQSTILDLVYMPLYIVTEVTDGNARNFVRSRSMLDISRTEGLGYIHCDGLEDIFSE